MSKFEPSSMVRRALDGIRVLDMTDKAAVYATKMLCDMGADVVRVEPVEGDPMRLVEPVDHASGQSYFHLYMNANKRFVSLDFHSDDGRQALARLIKSADIVVESHAPGFLRDFGLDYEAFATEHPGLIWCSITPFGSTGPYAAWKSNDLVSQAMGGLMTLSGLPEREPLKLHGEQSSFIAGLHAASAILIAHWHADAAGEGQHIDVSVHECIAHTLESAVQAYTCEGLVRARQSRSSEAGVGMFPCVDGEIFVYANVGMIASSWDNLVKWLNEERIDGAQELTGPEWKDLSWRKTQEARDKASAVIKQLTKSRKKYEIYAQLQTRRILSSPMCEIGDLFENAQLKFLNWFLEMPDGEHSVVWPGPPFRMSETPRRDPTHEPQFQSFAAQAFSTRAEVAAS